MIVCQENFRRDSRILEIQHPRAIVVHINKINIPDVYSINSKIV